MQFPPLGSPKEFPGSIPQTQNVSPCGLILESSRIRKPSAMIFPPGRLRAYAFKNVEPADEFSSNLTHTTSPEALLALAVQLYSRKPERAFLLTIGGASFDHADVPSEPVRAAIRAALGLI